MSYKIWDQIGRKVKRAHANYLKLIKIEDREVPERSRNKKRISKKALAASLLNKEFELSDSEVTPILQRWGNLGEENELHVDNHLWIGKDKEHEISFDQIRTKEGRDSESREKWMTIEG